MGNSNGLDKQGVISLCNKLGFDTGKYRLSYGSALVMHGVKKLTHDIDMEVSRDLFEELSGRYPLLDARFNEKYICIDSIIDVFISDGIGVGTEFIDGIPVASLEYVKEVKKKMGREKDLEDIKLIERYLHK